MKMVNYNNNKKFWERRFTRMIDEGFADLFLKKQWLHGFKNSWEGIWKEEEMGHQIIRF